MIEFIFFSGAWSSEEFVGIVLITDYNVLMNQSVINLAADKVLFFFMLIKVKFSLVEKNSCFETCYAMLSFKWTQGTKSLVKYLLGVDMSQKIAYYFKIFVACGSENLCSQKPKKRILQLWS